MNNKEQNISDPKQVLWILYGVLGFSQIMFIIVFEWFVYQEAKESIPFALEIFSGIAIVTAFLSHIFYRKRLRNPFSNGINRTTTFPSETQINDQNLSAYIVAWALGESVTVYGLLGNFFGINKPINYCFFAVGILLHLLHRPQFK
jgi:hypothetical protein